MILLKSIKLENFMAVKDLSLTFSDDSMVAISGQNGSGKSTLVYATAFALTNHRIEGITFKEYIKTGCDKAFVTLDADLDGSPLHCELEINKTGVVRNATYKGKSYVNSEYGQLMEEHNLNIADKLMFIFEGKNSIVDSTPAERATLLKELFQLNFDDIVADLKERQSASKEILIESTATLDSLKTQDFTRHPLQREPMKTAITQWTERLEEIDSDLSKLDDVDSTSLGNCKLKLTKVQRDIATITQKIKLERTQLASTDKLYQTLVQSVQGASIEQWRASRDTAQQELDTHVKDYEKTSQNYSQLNDLLRMKKHDIATLTEQIAIAKTGICHSCGQPVGKEHLDNLLMQKKALNEEVIAVQSKMDALDYDPMDEKGRTLRNTINDIDRKLMNYEANSKELESKKQRIEDLESLLSSHEEQLGSLKETESSLEDKYAELEKLKPLIEQKDTLREEKERLRASIQNAHDIEVSNNEKRRMNESLKRNEEARDLKVAELSAKVNDISLTMETTKKTLSIFENLFPNYVVLQACRKLEDYINAIIQKLFPYMSVRLKQNKGGVNFFYTPDGPADEERSVRLASGAQKIVLSLAYNVALARMYGITCILIDEADARMTPENAGLVYEFIASLEDFSQIIFISHRPESREAIKASGRNNLMFFEVNQGEYTQVSG